MSTFVKVTPVKYLLENPDKLVDQVNVMLSELSLGTQKDYEENINGYLFDTMLSRLVSSTFIVDHEDVFETYGFITIDVKLVGRVVTISVGNAVFGTENKRLNGVLYK